MWNYIDLWDLKKFSRDIIGKKALEKVNTRLEIIKLIKKYYENYDGDLSLEEISLKNEIAETKNIEFFSKFGVIFTMLTTIEIFLFNKLKIDDNLNEIINCLFGIILVTLFLVSLECVINIKRKYKKAYCELKIDIINHVQSEKDFKLKEILSNETNGDFLTFYKENIY